VFDRNGDGFIAGRSVVDGGGFKAVFRAVGGFGVLYTADRLRLCLRRPGYTGLGCLRRNTASKPPPSGRRRPRPTRHATEPPCPLPSASKSKRAEYGFTANTVAVGVEHEQSHHATMSVGVCVERPNARSAALKYRKVFTLASDDAARRLRLKGAGG
jgi:hypothetical protein